MPPSRSIVTNPEIFLKGGPSESEDGSDLGETRMIVTNPEILVKGGPSESEEDGDDLGETRMMSWEIKV